MTKHIRPLGLGLLLAALAAGCRDHHDHGDHDHGDHMGSHDNGTHDDALAALSPEDRAIVARQKTCPVSGETLGSMGEPIRMEHEGQVVFLCCDGCMKKFRADPAGYATKARR